MTWAIFDQCENIRTHHECEGGIQKSVLRITDWHHEACWVVSNGDREGQIFLSNPHTNYGYLFLHTPLNTLFYWKKWKRLPENPINTLRCDIHVTWWHHFNNTMTSQIDVQPACGFYTPPHFSVGVLCYTFRCPSVRPCSPFRIDNWSIYSRNFFKFCIHIVIGDEWNGIVNGQNLSIFNGVTALFRIGKMVSGLLFLYCSWYLNETSQICCTSKVTYCD